MGLFDSAFDALGLVPDTGGAVQSAQFNPVGVSGMFGSTQWNPDSRQFSAQLSPELQALQQQLFSQLGGISPDAQLSLFREQAAPFNEQMGLNLENRLFSQGLMGASLVDQPGGARRSFYDSVLNQDLQFQQAAQQQSMSDQINVLNQLFGLSNLEGGLFGQTAQMSGLAQNANQNLSNLQFQESTFMPNLIGSLLGAGIGAYGQSQGGT